MVISGLTEGFAAPVMLARFADLSARLVGAPDVATLASTYLAGARELVDASGLGFDLLDARTGEPIFTSGTGVSDFFLARYEAVGRPVDPVFAEAVRRRVPVLSSQLMSARQWRGHAVFRDVYRMHDFAGVLQAPLVHDGAVLGMLSYGSRHPTIDAADQRMSAALATIVAASLIALRARERAERDCRAVGAALEVCDQAIVMTSVARTGRRMNRAARSLLARIASPWTLDDELARAGERGLNATVHARVQLSDGSWATVRTQTMPAPTDPDTSVAVLTLDADEAARLPASIAALLTRREGEVARRAAAGLRNDQIAHELGIAPNTVKQYLKAAYRKLGVSTRAQLARRL
jgi:DNA-binding CsgD family transcriptional regulator